MVSLSTEAGGKTINQEMVEQVGCPSVDQIWLQFLGERVRYNSPPT